MIVLILFLACAFASLILGGLAAWSDMRGMTIPNLYSALIAGAFLLAFLGVAIFGPGAPFSSFLNHALAGLIVFGITALMFALRVIGAGDSKLASAYALWAGIAGLPAFLLYTTLAGGVLALAALGLRKWKPFAAAQQGSWIAQAQEGASKVPYGAAILVGALVAFVHADYFNPETLAAFLRTGG